MDPVFGFVFVLNLVFEKPRSAFVTSKERAGEELGVDRGRSTFATLDSRVSVKRRSPENLKRGVA